MKRIQLAWSTEREVLAALVVLLLVVTALCLVVAGLLFGFFRTLQWLDRSRVMAMTAEDLYRHLLTAESSGYSYIITGHSGHLEPYEESVENVLASRTALLRLMDETPHDSTGTQAVMAEIDSTLADLADLLAVRRRFGFEAAQSVIDTRMDPLRMGRIGDWLREVILAERAQIDSARVLVIVRVRTITGLALVLMLVVLALAVVVYALVRRGVQSHRVIEEGLSAALRRERELNELKSHFVRTVSHEFRTPLSIIQTSSDLVRHYGYRMTEEQRDRHLDKLQTQIVRLTALLEDAVTVQKSELADLPYTPALHDLRDICRRAIDSVAGAAGERRIDFAESGSGFSYNVDAALLERGLRNLLMNALLFSEASSIVRVHLSAGIHAATIDVIDQGVGIAAEDQPRLFDLFFRGANATDVQGAGLGLVVTKSIVDLHGGLIRFQSTPGSGSTFTIDLPVAQDAVAGQPAG